MLNMIKKYGRFPYINLVLYLTLVVVKFVISIVEEAGFGEIPEKF